MIGITDNSIINLDQSVTMQDADGNSVEVVKMYCSITKGQSIQYSMRVLKPVAFEANKADIQSKVDEFKAHCMETATFYNVPIV